MGERLARRTANASTTVVGGGAYHIVTNEPVAVYQFNPRDYTIGGTYSYTNDASLLLPVNAMTQNYFCLSTGATWDVYTGVGRGRRDDQRHPGHLQRRWLHPSPAPMA